MHQSGQVVQPLRLGLTVADEQRRRRRLSAIAPSAAWVDACFEVEEGIDAEGTPTETVRFRRLCPPRADTSPMRVCPICDRYTPHHYWVAGVCADCAILPDDPVNEVWGTSPWHQIMEFVRASGVELR